MPSFKLLLGSSLIIQVFNCCISYTFLTFFEILELTDPGESESRKSLRTHTYKVFFFFNFSSILHIHGCAECTHLNYNFQNLRLFVWQLTSSERSSNFSLIKFETLIKLGILLTRIHKRLCQKATEKYLLFKFSVMFTRFRYQNQIKIVFPKFPLTVTTCLRYHYVILNLKPLSIIKVHYKSCQILDTDILLIVLFRRREDILREKHIKKSVSQPIFSGKVYLFQTLIWRK